MLRLALLSAPPRRAAASSPSSVRPRRPLSSTLLSSFEHIASCRCARGDRRHAGCLHPAPPGARAAVPLALRPHLIPDLRRPSPSPSLRRPCSSLRHPPSRPRRRAYGRATAQHHALDDLSPQESACSASRRHRAGRRRASHFVGHARSPSSAARCVPSTRASAPLPPEGHLASACERQALARRPR